MGIALTGEYDGSVCAADAMQSVATVTETSLDSSRPSPTQFTTVDTTKRDARTQYIFQFAMSPQSSKNKLSPRSGETMCPPPRVSTRGGSTLVRGRVRRPHMAKLQAASVPIA